MNITIPEMQRVKVNYPIYKDIDDVALLNMAARKFPKAYKNLALEWGDRIRKQRAEQTQFEQQPTPDASVGAKLTRTQMRSSGLERLGTAQYIQANKERIPQPMPDENFFQYNKRFRKALALDQREGEKASHGTIPQFEDAMTVGVMAGMASHPAATAKMLAKFGSMEAIMEVTGIREKLKNIKNVDMRDAADFLVFGLMGLAAGVKWGKKAPIPSKKVVVDVEAARAVGERMRAGKPKAFDMKLPKVKNKAVKVTLDDALAKAKKAMEKPEPKAPPVSSKVEVTGFRKGKAEGEAGTFYSQKARGVSGEKSKKLDFKNLLEVPEAEVDVYEGLPSQSLIKKWFPNFDAMKKKLKISLEDEGLFMDKIVAKEARRRGYDGIRYGKQEIQDLRVQPKVEVISKEKGFLDQYKKQISDASKDVLKYSKELRDAGYKIEIDKGADEIGISILKDGKVIKNREDLPQAGKLLLVAKEAIVEAKGRIDFLNAKVEVIKAPKGFKIEKSDRGFEVSSLRDPNFKTPFETQAEALAHAKNESAYRVRSSTELVAHQKEVLKNIDKLKKAGTDTSQKLSSEFTDKILKSSDNPGMSLNEMEVRTNKILKDHQGALGSYAKVKAEAPPKITKEARKAEFREKLLKMQESKPKTTKPQDQVSTRAEDLVEVTIKNPSGQEVTKKMTSKQLFALKESIQSGEANVVIVDKATGKVTKKVDPREANRNKLAAEADKLLGERTIKDQLNDIGDVLEGGGLGLSTKTPKQIAKAEAAMNKLKLDAKKSGKELGKYLKENLKLDSASIGVIMKEANKPNSVAVQVKVAKGKPVTPGELAKKPVQVSDAIVQEKLRNAKSPQHKKNIMKKYGVKESTPTSDPAVVKDVPAIDPLMEKDTLFNPKDKASIAINNKINANLDRAKRLAETKEAESGKYASHVNNWVDTTFALQGVQERTGAPVYSKVYLPGVDIANVKEKRVTKLVDSFVQVLKGGLHSVEGDTRIVNWITKRKGKLNELESKTANKLMDILRDMQPVVKYLRMRRWAEGVEKVPRKLRGLVTQGKNILKKEGVGALEKWAGEQDFGVIKNDRYIPAEILRGLKLDLSKRNAYESIARHTKTRSAKEQFYDNTIPLAQRLHSYLERVLGDYYFYDYLKDTKGIADTVSMGRNDQMAFETWVGMLQGHGLPGIGAWGRGARKARGQFFKTILFDPSKWARNLLQNPAFLFQNYPLSTNIKKTAITVGMKVSDVERSFFDTHVSQLGALRREYMYLYENQAARCIG